MTAEDYLKYLKLESKKFQKNKEIFDIILYGSYIKGKRKPNDIDILIIFKETPLKTQLEKVQEFKNKIISKINEDKLDIKSINLKDLFDKTILSRQGVLTEGFSLIDNHPFSKKLGFTGKSLISYNLSNLSNSNKTKFLFSLSGRRNEKGLIEKFNMKKLGKSVLLCPIEKTELIREFLEKWEVKFEIKNILVQEYI